MKEQEPDSLKMAIDSMVDDEVEGPRVILGPVALKHFFTLVRNAALEQAKQIDWTEIMREGQLVTWGDAETLRDRVTEKLESLKEPTP